MEKVQFGCTLCGRCCHGHSLPLTFAEAIDWLEDGGKIGLFCEAHPYLDDSGAASEHRRLRSFEVHCGVMRVPVTVILVAVFSGACHHLRADLTCGAYDRRPLVCRIYPAEINPFVQLNVASKVCPPEAWKHGADFLINGKVADGQLQGWIEQSRQTDRSDVERKRLLCDSLNINMAGVSGEGYVAHQAETEVLLPLLKAIQAGAAPKLPQHSWRLYSPVAATYRKLWAAGLEMWVEKPDGQRYLFLHAPGALIDPIAQSRHAL